MILEIVEYQLKPEVSDEDYNEACKKAYQFLSRQPGFIDWVLAKNEKGRLDIVKWESREQADQAQQEFMKNVESEELKGFVQAVVEDSISMRYFEQEG